MFYDQVKHAEKCFEIINMLFKITYKTDERGRKTIKSLNLSDALVIKGFPELYRINRLTREHLANYHSNCENKYQTAVGFIVEGEKAKKNAATAETTAKAKAEANAKAAAVKTEMAAKAAAAKAQQDAAKAATAKAQQDAAAKAQQDAAKAATAKAQQDAAAKAQQDAAKAAAAKAAIAKQNTTIPVQGIDDSSTALAVRRAAAIEQRRKQLASAKPSAKPT
jgi:chemotaxis protein histidine kinase CheA